MKSLKFKDKRRRLVVSARELDTLTSRFLTSNRLLPSTIKVLGHRKLLRNRFNNISKVVNRCVLTGRSRAVYRDLKISRIMLRELANKGELTGIRKSSW